MQYGYGSPPGSRSPLHPWDVSSAPTAYALSALFDGNLGVEAAVLVRGSRSETLIVERDPGGMPVVEVPVTAFDKAIEEVGAWMVEVQGP